MTMSKWGGLALVTAAALWTFGCDTTNRTAVAAALAATDKPKVRIFGTVMNQETGQPVAAQVSVCGFGTTTTDATGTFIFDAVGVFPWNSDPNPYVDVKIEAPGLATIEHVQEIYNNYDLDSGAGGYDERLNEVTLVDLGTLFMRPGQDVKVVVTKDGSLLPDAVVTAFLAQVGGFALVGEMTTRGDGDGTQFAVACANVITGKTDSNGAVTLANLDPIETYIVVVPSQNLDGKPGLDFESESVEFEIQQMGAVLAINVVSAVPGTSPDAVGTNLTFMPDQQGFSFYTGPITPTPNTYISDSLGNRGVEDFDEYVSFNHAITTADGSVRVVFSTPVEILTGVPGLEPGFSYRDNMITPPTANAVADTKIVSATATAVSNSLGTIWTFTPNQNLPANEFFTLSAFAQSTEDARITANVSVGGIYRPVIGNTSLTVELDNYNGHTDGLGLARQVYLDFGEVVEGWYKVLSIQDGANTTVFSSPVVIDIPRLNSMAFNDIAARNIDVADLGVTEGIRFRQKLERSYGSTISLNDSTATTPQKVTLIISVRDFDGVTLNEEVTLEVK